MNSTKFKKAIHYVLRYAIEHNGKAHYSCMYHLGCADNIPPSEEFNRKLQKFGSLEYNIDIDEYKYTIYPGNTWSYFQIDERGRKYIAEIEPSGISKTIRMALTICLSIIQIPFIIEGWGSYILNSILKFLSTIFFLLALISFIWWPLDMLCGICWMCCDWLKHKIWNREFTWNASAHRWTNHFPEL